MMNYLHASYETNHPSVSITTLPLELLRTIARLAIPGQTHDYFDDFDECRFLDNSRSLLAMTAVCRLLRNAVRTDKFLWTQIHCKMSVQLADMYLQLSEPLMISAHFLGKGIDYRAWLKGPCISLATATRMELMATERHVLAHSNRIGRLIFPLPSSTIIVDDLISIFTAIGPVFDNLSIMSFPEAHISKTGTLTHWIPSLLAFAPTTLTTLKLDALEDTSLLPLIIWPLRQLYLSFSSSYTPPTHDFRPVLARLAPSLEWLSLTLSRYPIPFSPGPPIRALHLRHLTLESPQVADSLDFLSRLSFSAASELQIQITGERMEQDSWTSVGRLPNELYRHHPSLTFAFKHSSDVMHTFEFKSLNSSASLSIRYRFLIVTGTGYQVRPLFRLDVGQLIHTMDDKLLLQVRDLHIRQDDEPVTKSDTTLRVHSHGAPQLILPCADIACLFQNIRSLTIDTKPNIFERPRRRILGNDPDSKGHETIEPYALKPINSQLLTFLNSEEGAECFPYLETLAVYEHRLDDPDGAGEKSLLAFIACRAQSNHIRKLVLSKRCVISASVRQAIAQASPKTVVKMNGVVIPVAD